MSMRLRENVVLEFGATCAISSARGVARARQFLGAALLLAVFPTNARAVILIEVIEPLILFEIEGLTFNSYSTSPDATLRIENTVPGHVGLIGVQGQVEPQTDLVLCALSAATLGEKVIIEIDVGPLRGPTLVPFIELDARGMATTCDVTEPALAALVSPLLFEFRLESEFVDPPTGERRSTFLLTSVQQVPEPSGAVLAAIAGLVMCTPRRKSCCRAGTSIHRG